MKNGKKFITITNREIYEQIQKTKEVVIEIHETMKSHQFACNEDRTKLWSTIKWVGGIISALFIGIIFKILGGN